MTRRWKLIAAAPFSMAALVAGGTAAVLHSSASSPGTPVKPALTLCGVGTVGADNPAGASDQDHPDGSTFQANEKTAGTVCTGQSSSAGSDTWSILHSNVNTVTEKGTEHGEFLRSGTSQEAGFDGHITEFDFSGDACSNGNRTVYYQSGTERACPTSFGPVGTFNTHGGASTGQHFRGTYGTLIFQDNSNGSACPVGSTTYCIQVDLAGQTN